MANYIEINSEDFCKFLQDKGFQKSIQKQEIVYFRRHSKDRNFIIKVYTSIRQNAKIAREVGTDAIRVCAVYDSPEFSKGIAKLPRVYRVGSQEEVFKRTLDRMREAYRICNNYIK